MEQLDDLIDRLRYPTQTITVRHRPGSEYFFVKYMGSKRFRRYEGQVGLLQHRSEFRRLMIGVDRYLSRLETEKFQGFFNWVNRLPDAGLRTYTLYHDPTTIPSIVKVTDSVTQETYWFR
jgi:hypothetical protein